MGGRQFGAHARFVQPACQADMGGKAGLRNRGLDRPAQFAIADQRQVQPGRAGHRQRQRLHQQGNALLFGKPPHGHHPARARGQGGGGGKARRVDPAGHDMQARPVGGIGPAHQLAAAKAGNGDREGRMARLHPQRQRAGGVEFLGAMHGEAVGDARQHARQHGDRGRVGAEVRVDVLHALALRVAGDKGGLSEIDQVSHGSAGARHPAAACLPAGQGEAKRLRHPARGGGSACQHRTRQPGAALFQHAQGAGGFVPVAVIHKGGCIGAHGQAQNRMPPAFQRADFAADEAV